MSKEEFKGISSLTWMWTLLGERTNGRSLRLRSAGDYRETTKTHLLIIIGWEQTAKRVSPMPPQLSKETRVGPTPREG